MDDSSSEKTDLDELTSITFLAVIAKALRKNRWNRDSYMTDIFLG